MQIKAELVGLGTILKKLDRYGRKVRGQALRKMLRAGGNVIKKAVQSNAPVQTGLLKAKEAIRIKIYRKSDVGVVIVGPQRKVRALVYIPGLRKALIRSPTKYTHLVEEDTDHSRGTHFLARAVAEHGPEAVQAMIDKAREVLNAL